jgi:hypothetical protein
MVDFKKLKCVGDTLVFVYSLNYSLKRSPHNFFFSRKALKDISVLFYLLRSSVMRSHINYAVPALDKNFNTIPTAFRLLAFKFTSKNFETNKRIVNKRSMENQIRIIF